MSVKHDGGKARWDLLPIGPLRTIVAVLGFGCEKYGPDQWQDVEDARRRYYAALQRHATDWWRGEVLDPESGLHHLAHAGCCLLFLLWFEQERP